jgi:hypothetical protein
MGVRIATGALQSEVAKPTWKNSGAETARVLFLYAPAAAGGVFEESQRLQRSYKSFHSEDVRAAYRRHRWEIVGPPPF